MKYKSYICLKYYPISFANSMKNLTKPKNKQNSTAINERISNINSDIEELYKRYRLTRQERIDKEKSQKSLISRINFLTDEEKKLSKKCELQLQKINAIRKNYSTVNGTVHNTPPHKKKLYDLGNFSNFSDNKSIKHKKIYDITEEKASLENTRSKDSQNRSIMNNICIIVNNNEMKGVNNNSQKNLQIDNKEEEIKDNKISQNKINSNSNKYIKINNTSLSSEPRDFLKSFNFNESNIQQNKYGTPFYKDYDQNISNNNNNRIKGKIKNTNSNFMNKSKNHTNKKTVNTSKSKLHSKSKDILVIKTNKEVFFHNPKHNSFLSKKNKNKNNQDSIQPQKSIANNKIQQNNYEKKNAFNDILMTNISRSHIPKKRKKFENSNNNNSNIQINNRTNNTYKSKNENSTISLCDENKTITYNKSIELKKKFLGIPNFGMDEKSINLINGKQVINSYKDEKTTNNNFGTHSQFFNNNNNLDNGIYSNFKKIEKKKNLKTGNLLKNLDIINRIQRNKETIKYNESSASNANNKTMNNKNGLYNFSPNEYNIKRKNICDTIELNDNNSVVKIVKKIQQINEYKENKEIQNNNVSNKKIQNNNFNIPRREIETLRRINNKIQNYKNNNNRNFGRKTFKKLYGINDNKKKRANSKSSHSFLNKKFLGEVDGEDKRKRYSFSKKRKHFNKS